MELFNLRGKTAVVTGASGALGSAIAQGLAMAGANLALCYNSNREKAETLASRLASSHSVQAVACQVDARTYEAQQQHAEQVRATFGRLDILVNCAGGNVADAQTSKERNFFQLRPQALEEAVRLNLFGGCVWPCMAYGQQMLDNEQGGSIVNITSMNAFRPLEGRPGYAAAKAAVSNFTMWLAAHIAMECHPLIRVNAVAPGFVPNERTRASLINTDGSYAERGQRILAHTPMNRLGTPEDMVGTCVWYASDASRFVTGTVTPVDGGFNAYSGV